MHNPLTVVKHLDVGREGLVRWREEDAGMLESLPLLRAVAEDVLILPPLEDFLLFLLLLALLLRAGGLLLGLLAGGFGRSGSFVVALLGGFLARSRSFLRERLLGWLHVILALNVDVHGIVLLALLLENLLGTFLGRCLGFGGGCLALALLLADGLRVVTLSILFVFDGLLLLGWRTASGSKWFVLVGV